MALPEEMPGGTFDLLNTLSSKQDEALGEKLKEQLGLTARREVRETDALRLQAKDSAKLASHRARGTSVSTYMTGDGTVQRFHFENAKLAEVAARGEGFFGKPIVDCTAITDRFNFTIEWKSGLSEPAIRRSIEDQLTQLGLELVSSREPVEMLVVEKVR